MEHKPNENLSFEEIVRKLADTPPEIIKALESENYIFFIKGKSFKITAADFVRKCQKLAASDFQDLKIQETENIEAPINTVADEIRKLADLKADGLLTEEEFQAAKRKVIGL